MCRAVIGCLSSLEKRPGADVATRHRLQQMLPRWAAAEAAVQTHAAEARDNVRYLATLEPFFACLYHGPGRAPPTPAVCWGGAGGTAGAANAGGDMAAARASMARTAHTAPGCPRGQQWQPSPFAIIDMLPTFSIRSPSFGASAGTTTASRISALLARVAQQIVVCAQVTCHGRAGATLKTRPCSSLSRVGEKVRAAAAAATAAAAVRAAAAAAGDSRSSSAAHADEAAQRTAGGSSGRGPARQQRVPTRGGRRENEHGRLGRRGCGRDKSRLPALNNNGDDNDATGGGEVAPAAAALDAVGVALGRQCRRRWTERFADDRRRRRRRQKRGDAGDNKGGGGGGGAASPAARRRQRRGRLEAHAP